MARSSFRTAGRARDEPSLVLAGNEIDRRCFAAVLRDQAVELDQQRRPVLRVKQLAVARPLKSGLLQVGPHVFERRRLLPLRVIDQCLYYCRQLSANAVGSVNRWSDSHV